MKKVFLKVLPMLVLGVSLSACSMLNNVASLVGGGNKQTKFSSYKNEVSEKEFGDGLKKSLLDSPYLKQDFQLGDAVLDASYEGKFSQKVTNDSYAKPTRSEVSAKSSGSAKLAYDKDNSSIAFTAKEESSGKYNNSLLGEGSIDQKLSLDFLFQQNNSTQYALINKSDKTYYSLDLASPLDLNRVLTSGIQSGVAALASMLPEGEESSEYEDVSTVANLKYYWDKNVFTVVGNVKLSQDLASEEMHYDEVSQSYYYEPVSYGTMSVEGEVKLQVSIGDAVKVRAYVKADVTARFFADHEPILGGLFTISGLATQNCVKGDRETISLEASAGLDFAQKKVSNKQVNLNGYKKLIVE